MAARKITATRNILNPDEIHFDLLGVLGCSLASLVVPWRPFFLLLLFAFTADD
jgi:hypothetical protein